MRFGFPIVDISVIHVWPDEAVITPWSVGRDKVTVNEANQVHPMERLVPKRWFSAERSTQAQQGMQVPVGF